MNIIVTSFLKQNVEMLKKYSEENNNIIEAIGQSEDSHEYLEKHLAVLDEVMDKCLRYVELDEHETNIYMHFARYIFKYTNINYIENLMWQGVLEPKEVNKVSNAIREVQQRVGSENLYSDFIKFTCSDLKESEVKPIVGNVINMFTRSNNSGDVMGIMLSY